LGGGEGSGSHMPVDLTHLRPPTDLFHTRCVASCWGAEFQYYNQKVFYRKRSKYRKADNRKCVCQAVVRLHVMPIHMRSVYAWPLSVGHLPLRL